MTETITVKGRPEQWQRLSGQSSL